MATERRCTGQPVTSLPSTSTRPLVGSSSPAIRRISEVLPGKRRPEQHVERAALKRQRDVANMDLAADLLADAFENQRHAGLPPAGRVRHALARRSPENPLSGKAPAGRSRAVRISLSGRGRVMAPRASLSQPARLGEPPRDDKRGGCHKRRRRPCAALKPPRQRILVELARALPGDRQADSRRR